MSLNSFGLQLGFNYNNSPFTPWTMYPSMPSMFGTNGMLGMNFGSNINFNSFANSPLAASLFGNRAGYGMAGKTLPGALNQYLASDWQKNYKDVLKPQEESAANKAYTEAADNEVDAATSYNKILTNIQNIDEEITDLRRDIAEKDKEWFRAQQDYEAAPSDQKEMKKTIRDDLKAEYESLRDKLTKKQEELEEQKAAANKAKNKVEEARRNKENIFKTAKRSGVNLDEIENTKLNQEKALENKGDFLKLTRKGHRNLQRLALADGTSKSSNKTIKIDDSTISTSTSGTEFTDDQLDYVSRYGFTLQSS